MFLSLRDKLAEVERRRDLRRAAPWFDRLNEPRRAALEELARLVGGADQLPMDALCALRDEHYEHAAALLRRGAEDGRYARIERQLATGQWQRVPYAGPPDLADPVSND